MRRLIALLALLLPIAASAQTTTNNDDSCDIAQLPAATLLLPYFEVDTARRSVDTFFSVTNVSNQPQIAHVTVWTDWSFPVLTFNLFLTGYDVQEISMYDVIVNGIVAPTNANLTAGGTSTDTPPGALSAANKDGNPLIDVTDCGRGLLPGILGPAIRSAVQSALTTGIYRAQFGGFSGCGANARVGSAAATHRLTDDAVGYVTIDVTSKCSATMPADPSYFVNEILFDNVLTGESFLLDRNGGIDSGTGNPLVHIRAIPEGGAAGTASVLRPPTTSLPYTFYGRFINGQAIDGAPVPAHCDRRQPLSSTFAARFIQGGPASFSTDLEVWREGVAGSTTCANAAANANLPIAEVVRFDEHENANIYSSFLLSAPANAIVLPATSRVGTASAAFPVMSSPAGDTGGWLYLNLDSGKSDPTINTVAHPTFVRRPSQNWVVVSMTSAGSIAGLFGTSFDAISLGNGCSPHTPTSTANLGPTVIGPAPNANP